MGYPSAVVSVTGRLVVNVAALPTLVGTRRRQAHDLHGQRIRSAHAMSRPPFGLLFLFSPLFRLFEDFQLNPRRERRKQHILCVSRGIHTYITRRNPTCTDGQQRGRQELIGVDRASWESNFQSMHRVHVKFSAMSRFHATRECCTTTALLLITNQSFGLITSQAWLQLALPFSSPSFPSSR